MRSFLSDSSRDEYGWGWQDEKKPDAQSQDTAKEKRKSTILTKKEFPYLQNRLAQALQGDEVANMFGKLAGQKFLLDEADKANTTTVDAQPSFLTVESTSGVFLYIRFWNGHAIPEFRPKKSVLSVQDYYSAFSALKGAAQELFRRIGYAVVDNLPQ